MVVLVVLAVLTGYLLPWDQLALWAVTVGENLRGYLPLFGDRVRFVLLGGAEVSPQTLLWWLLAHGLLAVLSTGLIIAAWRAILVR